MSTRQETDTQEVVITHRDQLAAPMAAGEKPQSAWRIGTEHEKFVYARADHHAPSYDEIC